MPAMTARRHDPAYKKLFRSPRMVQHLIQGFVTDAALNSLDVNSLVPLPTELITRAFNKRQLDCAWQLQLANHQRVYVLIEFQSTQDPVMPLRTCTYSSLLYETLLAQGQIRADMPHWPPVLCIVFYSGDKPWRGSTRLHDRIWIPPKGLMKPAMLQHRFILVDINRDAPDNADELQNLVAILMRFERHQSPAELQVLMDLLEQLLLNDPALLDQFGDFIADLMGDSSSFALKTSGVTSWKEIKMNFAQRMAKWEQGFIQQGMQQGIHLGQGQGKVLGQVELLSQQLKVRFGDLNEATEERLRHATSEQLQHWAVRVLQAQTLHEVFGAQS